MIQLTTKAAATPRKKSLWGRLKRTDRYLLLSFLFTHTAALAIASSVLAGPYSVSTTSPADTLDVPEMEFTDPLLKTLSDPKFQAAMEIARQEKLTADIAAAETAREEAEALLVSAESQVSAAQDRAKQIRLEASLAGADKVGSGEEGEPITLDYEARNGTCDMTEFGYTMTLHPTGNKGIIRTLVNVGTCGTSELFEVGRPVAFYGKYPVGEFARSVKQ